jgi:hypothetical protein
MANQLPMAPGSMTLTTITKPALTQSVYDRAMTCSSN